MKVFLNYEFLGNRDYFVHVQIRIFERAGYNIIAL